MPRLLTVPAALRLCSERWRAAGLVVGLVPTMGALHAGHISLIRRARAECDRVIVSIFVNPAQFGPGEDLARYPRPFARDVEVCAAEGVDAVFHPEPEAMYPPDFAINVHVGGVVTQGLEAATRPGHFDGVALVVAKLLVASRTDRVYIGQKDAQQCAVISRVAADLDTVCEVVVCPVVRDHDGLALSSRNAYLDADERVRARAIPRGLARAAQLVGAGESDPAAVVAAVRAEIEAVPDVVVEYVEAVDSMFRRAATMGPETRIVVAARIGRTRLIDTLCPGVDAVPDVAPPVASIAGRRGA